MPRNDSSAPEPELRVGYILKMFPRLSETFILNELLELENQGVGVSVFSLMYPNDGRFHGRLGNLAATTEYFVRDKPEVYWQKIRSLADGVAPEWSRWEEAADFLRRWNIPKDLDLLLRAIAIAISARQQGIQHLHAHFATIATRVAALVNILTDIPFSFTSHAKDIFRETVNRDLYKELVDRAAFNITVSDFNKEFILEHTPGVAADKIVRLYNGIDLDFFDARTESPQGEPHIVSVGRLVPKKGFNYLLDAFRMWKDEGRSFRATIIGDGEDRDVLLAQHAALELEDSVMFTGALPQEEVRRICADATLMVLACVPDEIGNRDALPTTLLEALALDVPVVSTRLTGVPEIVGDEAGEVVEPGDVPALAAAMSRVTEKTLAGNYPAGAARGRAERLFDLRQNVGTLRQHFAESATGARVP